MAPEHLHFLLATHKTGAWLARLIAEPNCTAFAFGVAQDEPSEYEGDPPVLRAWNVQQHRVAADAGRGGTAPVLPASHTAECDAIIHGRIIAHYAVAARTVQTQLVHAHA